MTNTNHNAIRLGRNDAALYDALDTLNGMDYAKEHGEFFATNEKLRNLTGIATDVQLIRSIRKLEKNGIIDRKAGKRGEASVYVFHEVEGVVSKSVSENVSETENQRVMKKKRQNVSNNVSNVSEMLVKLNINELSEIITNIVSETIQPLRDELREINANLLKMSNTNTFENVSNNVSNKIDANTLKMSNTNIFQNYTNKNENVSTDTDIETDKEIKTNLKLNYSSTHAHEASADVPAGEAEDLSFRVFDEGNPTGGVDVPDGGSDPHRLPDGITPSSDEDLSFNEFLVNGDDSPQAITDSVATTSVATETTPQSGDPKKIAPPAPPRGDMAPTPSTPKMPQDAQDLPMAAFIDSRGITVHPQQKNATQGKYGGRTSDLITNALEAIDAAKQTRKRVGKYRTLDECMEIVNSMDAAYKAMAAVVKQAQERARMDDVNYTGYHCVNEVWNTERSGWTERQKNMIYRMAQDCDNLMLHHPWKCRLDRLHELIENLAHEPNPEKGENLIEKILNHIDALTSIADGSPMREKKINDIAAGDFAKALDAHNRLTDMLKQYTFDEPTTLTTVEPATAYNSIAQVMDGMGSAATQAS